MNKGGKRLVVAAVVAAIIIVLSIINLFVYPFKSSQPNFADVERVFNKIEIPADWAEISSTENSGIAGRACPIEPGSACFHKSKTFSTPTGVGVDTVKLVLMSSGCPTVGVADNSYVDSPNSKYTLECSIDGLDIGSDLDISKGQVYVSANTP